MSIFIFLSICSFGQNRSRYDWSEIETPADGFIKILAGNSLNELWLTDNEGTLYHYLNGKWNTYYKPVDETYTRIIIENFAPNSFIMVAMDSLWHSHFYKFLESKWISSSFSLDVPVQRVFSIDGETYAICNFGRMLKLVDNKWTEIKTPIKSHINFVAPLSKENIYLLTKSEGIFHFNGKNFRHLEESIKFELFSMSMLNNNIFVIGTGNKRFKLINEKLVRIKDEDWPVESFVNQRGIIILVNNLYDNKETTKIEIPIIYKPASKVNIDNGRILFTNRDGKLLVATPTDKIFFREMAKPFGIEGNEEVSQIGLIHSDLNNDNSSDILMLSQRFKLYISLFYFDKNSPFIDQSNIVPKIEANRVINFRCFDFDSDGKMDIVFQGNDSTGSFLRFLRKSGTGFEIANELRLPENWTNFGISNFTPVDIDMDGDLDICATYYYGEKDQPGFNLFFINKWWGKSWAIDSSYKKITSGWNMQSIFADFNNDDLTDWFIINKWRKPKLLINNGDGFVDESETRLIANKVNENYAAGAADLDNDGDLDLVVTSDQSKLQIYQNNGNGIFRDISAEINLRFPSLAHKIGHPIQLNIADYNNDGFDDILIFAPHMENSACLLISDSGKTYIDQTADYRFKTNNALTTISGDFDNDGDIDIYDAHYGKNSFWSNNLNENSFIKISLHGVLSNTNALGAKIWLYEQSSNGKKIAGYKQIGSNEFGYAIQSDLIAHFGVDVSKIYSAKIKFLDGREFELDQISPGSRLTIKEYENLADFLIMLPGNVFRILINHEVQAYFLVLIFSLIIILGGIKFGVLKFQWDFKLTSLFTAINLSLAWIIIFLTLDSQNFYLKYFLPLAIVFGGVMIPVLVFTISRKQLSNVPSFEKLEDELLQLLITFSHGEWALRNINSLQLFFQNFAKTNLASQKYLDQLNNRVNTFIELTQINILRIIELSEALSLNSGATNELRNQFNNTLKFLQQINEPEILLNTEEYMFIETASSIEKIKFILGELKLIIYSRFSCNPKTVISRIVKIFEQPALDKNCSIAFNDQLPENYFVLIKKNELADALDNLLVNAIRAVENFATKEIEITLKRVIPKIHIEVSDTGIGINKLYWQDIFERGFSDNKSTGEGLYSVKKSLEKYGGRIYVKASRLNHGTTFAVELLEGIKNETVSTNN